MVACPSGGLQTSLAYMFQMIQGRGTAVLKKASKSELMSEIIDVQLRETEWYGEARAIGNDRAVSGNTVPEFDIQLILGLQQYKDETIWYFQRC